MTTVIRKASAAELLAALPALVGRDPHGSVVLLAFAGKRTHATLRFDLPRSGFGRFTSTVVGTFCRIPGADDVVPVICSDTPVRSHATLMGTLVARFRQAGFPVRDALVVGGDGWASHLDPDGRLHPLDDITDAAARLALESPAEIPDRVPRADEVSCRRMADELARLRMLLAAVDGSDTDLDDEADLDLALDELEPLADLPFLAEGALSWTADELSHRGALLLLALQGPPARDLVTLQWAFGLALGDALWSEDTCVGIEARKDYADPDAFAAELLMGRGPAPALPRVERAIEVLLFLVARAADPERPALLCMLAWLNWSLGRGSAAGAHLDEALAIDPGYGMALLFDRMFSTGMLPEWVFSTDRSA